MAKNKGTAEENTAARDFTMARLAACRGALAAAAACLDDALAMFCATADDSKGKIRSELLEAIDANIGDAARAVQLAQAGWVDVDPAEEEPEGDDLEDGTGDDDEDSEDDEEDE